MDFDTDELIRKSIASFDSKLRVAKIYFKVETGMMDSFKSREDLIAAASLVKEDSGICTLLMEKVMK